MHTDLLDVPEEYEGEKTVEQEQDSVRLAREMFDPASQVDMLATLPHEGDLPLIYHLPWLTWDGKETYEGAIQRLAAKYKQTFREQVGQCVDESAESYQPQDPYAKDLFCAAKA